MTSPPRKYPMDTCHSWLIFLSAFMIAFLAFGQMLTFGIYFVSFADYFRLDKKSTGLIGAVCFTVTNTMGPFAGVLQRKYGARRVVLIGAIIASIGMIGSYFAEEFWHLYLTYGVLVGFGYGLAANPAISILPEYFEKHRHLATTLFSIGGSLGTLILAPFTLFIIETYTWRGAMLINAGLCLQILVFGSLLRSRTIDKNATIKELMNISVFKDCRFILLLIDGAITGGSGFVIFATVTELAVSRGLTTWQAGMLISIASFSSTISRILAALMSSFKKLDRIVLYTVTTLLGAAGVFVCVFAYDFWTFVVAVLIFGFSFGIKVSQVIIVVIDLLGVTGISVGIGYFMFSIGFGGFVLPLFAGWIADQTTSENAFIFMSVAIIIGFFCCCGILILRRRHRKKSKARRNEIEEDEKDALNHSPENVLAVPVE